MTAALCRRPALLRALMTVTNRVVPAARLGTALAVAMAAATAPVAAQTAPPAARPAAKAPARTPAPPALPAQPAAPLPDADNDQMMAAAITHVGDYACEFNETVKVSQHARHAGYIDVQHRKAVFTMKPVLSQTGALRLEDVRGRMLMLQIANKSMLMDTRIGQRVVDNCVHEKQRDFANQPPRESLGIAPPAAATGGASAPR